MSPCVEIEPVDDETLISQLVRLAEANGFRSVQEVHRRIEQEPPSLSDLLHGPTEAWLEAAAGRTGIPRSQLFSGTRLGGRYRSIHRWQPTHEKRVSVYCPACLAADGAWRLSWLLPYARVCLTHKTVLVDHRNACCSPGTIAARWSLSRTTTRLCDRKICALSLADQVARPASNETLREHNRLLEIDAEFRLRVLSDEIVELPTGRHAPRVLDVRWIRPRVPREPSVRLQLLDRPDWGIVRRVGER